MRISDWSSDVCSSDLHQAGRGLAQRLGRGAPAAVQRGGQFGAQVAVERASGALRNDEMGVVEQLAPAVPVRQANEAVGADQQRDRRVAAEFRAQFQQRVDARSEEHTSELQSLMRISYAVFCLKKKT